MTKTFTMQSQDESAPPQWLVSAFLVLLSVAILTAIPANSAANRNTTEAANSTRGLAERIVVRASIQVRVQPSQLAGNTDFALASVEAAPIPAYNDRIVPRAQDAGTGIHQRGINIRGPPTPLA